jgi:hypothetical protein
MNTLSSHYQRERPSSDCVASNLLQDMQDRTPALPLEFVRTRVVRPECGTACAMKDHAAERSRRRLDAMRFQTALTSRIPRCSGNRCGGQTILVPWAETDSRYTLLFEAFAIDVPKATWSIQVTAGGNAHSDRPCMESKQLFRRYFRRKTMRRAHEDSLIHVAHRPSAADSTASRKHTSYGTSARQYCDTLLVPDQQMTRRSSQ